MKVKTNVPEKPALIANVDKFYIGDSVDVELNNGIRKSGNIVEVTHNSVAIKGSGYQIVHVEDIKSVRIHEDKILAGQVHTERGIVNIEASYQSAKRAKMDGYDYAFHSNELGVDLYSKCLDDRGLRHTFAVVEGYC